jgi:hypothetical protein
MDNERAARQRRWGSARLKLQEKLGSLGLVLERDYRFHGEEWPQNGIGVEIRDENLMTSDFLIACSSALLESEDSDWAALVAIHDSTRINKMRSIVEIRCGGFTVISGGATRKIILEAYHKLGLGDQL